MLQMKQAVIPYHNIEIVKLLELAKHRKYEPIVFFTQSLLPLFAYGQPLIFCN